MNVYTRDGNIDTTVITNLIATFCKIHNDKFIKNKLITVYYIIIFVYFYLLYEKNRCMYVYQYRKFKLDKYLIEFLSTIPKWHI